MVSLGHNELKIGPTANQYRDGNQQERQFCWLYIHVVIDLGNVKASLINVIFNSLRSIDADICIGWLDTFGSDNGISPAGPQAIIWTNAALLLTGLYCEHFSTLLVCGGLVWVPDLYTLAKMTS